MPLYNNSMRPRFPLALGTSSAGGPGLPRYKGGETWRARTSSWEWQDRIGAEAATASGAARARHLLARAAVLAQRGVEERGAWREHSERRGEAWRWSVVRRAAWVFGAAHILKRVVGRPEAGMVSCKQRRCKGAAKALQGRCKGAARALQGRCKGRCKGRFKGAAKELYGRRMLRRCKRAARRAARAASARQGELQGPPRRCKAASTFCAAVALAHRRRGVEQGRPADQVG